MSRRRARSPSSSSSGSSAGYREYRAAKATAAEEDRLRKQADIIVRSIRSSWDSSAAAAPASSCFGVAPSGPAAAPAPQGPGRSPLPAQPRLPAGMVQPGRSMWRCSGCASHWDVGVGVCEAPACPLGMAVRLASGAAFPPAPAASASPGCFPPAPPPAPQAAEASVVNVDLRILEAALGFKIPLDQLGNASGSVGELEALLRTVPAQSSNLLARYVEKVGGKKARFGGSPLRSGGGGCAPSTMSRGLHHRRLCTHLSRRRRDGRIVFLRRRAHPDRRGCASMVDSERL